MLHINGERLIADLRTLANFGKAGAGVDRVALSPQDIEARRWLCDRLREAGLEARMDRVGNVVGEYPKVQKSVLIGSHTDTVPRGGWLDGALGVIYGLEIARSQRESGGTPSVGVDVISFEDEEGTYLPCLGSRSFCGTVTDSEIGAAKSKSGATLTNALGIVQNELPPFRLNPARHLAYLEAHIEQGPRLETAGRRVGIVTGIVGIRRFRVTAHGQADHAGTTPIAMRKDAAAALFKLAVRIGSEFPRLGGPDTVWNIGTFALWPDAANVVPNKAEMTLEFRDTEIATLDRLERAFLDWVTEAASGPVAVEAAPTARLAPAAMAAQLGEILTTAAAEHGESALSLPSGAGHDGMFLASFVPSAMIFVPSIGGRSHDVTENTAESDIIFGCQVLATATDNLIRTLA
jgi:beta-ureidopropionase / N-carbamoyl-L-amino-acid hydrolase